MDVLSTNSIILKNIYIYLHWVRGWTFSHYPLLVPLFPTTFLPPTQLSVNMPIWIPASSAMTFCDLPSLWRMWTVFWTSVKSIAFCHDCAAYWPRERPVTGSGNLCRSVELISWWLYITDIFLNFGFSLPVNQNHQNYESLEYVTLCIMILYV